jgi:hypothetical protein
MVSVVLFLLVAYGLSWCGCDVLADGSGGRAEGGVVLAMVFAVGDGETTPVVV